MRYTEELKKYTELNLKSSCTFCYLC